MMSAVPAMRRPGVRAFAEVLKVEARLSLREPYALGLGIALPVILLILFAYISSQVPGNVANSGRTVLQLWIPTIIVISFISIAISLPNTLVRDREIGWLRRISTTPVHPSMLLAAQLVINLAIAVAAMVIVIVGGALIMGAPLDVNLPYFVLSVLLSLAAIFSLGLLIVALAPSETAGRTFGALAFFPLLFLSGLWVQPAQVGEPLRSVMYYSPAGAAARALLDSAFDLTPPVLVLLALALYAVVFSFLAIRFFRWE